MNNTATPDWSLGPQDTAVHVLARAVEQFPDHTFLIFPDGELTYAEFERRSNALAHGLAAQGVAKGDTVSTILDNNLDCVLAWFAVNKLGAIWVPINTAYKGTFLQHLIGDSGAKIVIAETDYAERLMLIEDELQELQQVYYRGTRPGKTFNALPMAPLDTLYAEDDSPLEIVAKPGDICKLIYTGGTTGPSKGCMISHNFACNLGRQGLSSSARQQDEVHWSCLPLFHMNATATTVLSSAMLGGTAYFESRFSLSGFWPSIEKSGAKLVNLIGSMIPLIAHAPDEPAMERCKGQLRVSAGAPFPEDLQRIWIDRFGVVQAGANGYGFTEACLLTSLPYGEPAKPGSSGKRNEWFDVRIFDDDGKELGPNQPGEIVARPLQPNVMFAGYWRRPQDTLNIMADLWLHTGDIGLFDEDGFFFFVDRKKDYLRRGGENISSFEMENTIGNHPAIQEVAVHAVLSELSEDELKATVVLHEDADLSERELCLWAIERVPYFAVPRYIEFRKQLPKNPVGRVLKYTLRDEGCTAATWDRTKSDIELKKR
jgi:carnitine-CoA ligase